MKYGDLIDFEPLETVKELRAADDIDQAREDVKTFVISTRLAEDLNNLIIPHLRFDQPAEGGNKGLLVVANYGTGKTHLMSVLSAIAEHQDLLSELTDSSVADAAETIAGRFKVIRAEIGFTKLTSLHDVVIAQLEQGMKDLGVDFEFKDDKATGSKEGFERMMTAFEAKYPEHGLLFVLDELLDYLRQLKDAELIQALMFLREVGEIARSTRFRFISGVQEAIFDNPRFAHVADAVRRVRDRFEQIRISREDVAFVVRQRLLKKAPEHADTIRTHLTKFAPMYEGLAERMDDFVAMFPVHPAYLRTFEQISVVEKRTVLKTLSQEMRKLLDQEVPDDHPGLVCSDSYRGYLDADPSFRAIPDVRDVLDRTEKLRAKINQGMTETQYVPVAHRIVDGLAVHRLTTDGLDQPIGMTAENLRDELMLLPPGLPKQDAKFLAMTVKTIVGKVITAVSGQFISENAENGQFYLDVDKDIDYDQQIEDRAQALDKERLDDAYFQALEEVLERRDEPYVSGYRIWEYQVPWEQKNVTRIGYLFMGSPNERSTAQPPRDYYAYFIQPYAPPKFDDKRRDDEVFFHLDKPGDDFTASLRRYAGAYALERESTGRHRDIYADKRKTALRSMVTWLRSNMGTAVNVTYRGETKQLAHYLGKVAASGTVKDQIDSIASTILANHFDARYPGYPVFGVEITKASLHQAADQALSHIATGRSTIQSTKVLESLELLDASGGFVAFGSFADALVKAIKKAKGQVVNRSDLLTERDPGLFTWAPWHLEPTWLVVVAAALVQLGKAEISFPGAVIDALRLDQLPKMSQKELETFTHIGPPKELPVVQLRRVATLVGLPEGVITDGAVSDDVVRELISKAVALSDRATAAQAAMTDRGQLWGAVLFDRADELEAGLDALVKVLADVRNRNTPGKMSKLSVSDDVLDEATTAKAELERIESVLSARDKLDEVASYLRQASDVFGAEFDLSKDAETLRAEMVDALSSSGGTQAQTITQLRNQGNKLRKRFAEAAAKGYRHHYLDAKGDERKKAILNSREFAQLHQLSSLDLLPGGTFAAMQMELTSIQTLLELDEESLSKSVLLPNVSFRPGPVVGMSAAAKLEDLERRIGDLHENWASTLLESLKAEEIGEQIGLLDPPDQTPIKAFVDSGTLPDDVDAAFVKALGSVFKKFQVVSVEAGEMWDAVFPGDSPTTVADMKNRFDQFVASLTKKSDIDRLRIVPRRHSGESE